MAINFVYQINPDSGLELRDEHYLANPLSNESTIDIKSLIISHLSELPVIGEVIPQCKITFSSLSVPGKTNRYFEVEVEGVSSEITAEDFFCLQHYAKAILHRDSLSELSELITLSICFPLPPFDDERVFATFSMVNAFPQSVLAQMVERHDVTSIPKSYICPISLAIMTEPCRPVWQANSPPCDKKMLSHWTAVSAVKGEFFILPHAGRSYFAYGCIEDYALAIEIHTWLLTEIKPCDPSNASEMLLDDIRELEQRIADLKTQRTEFSTSRRKTLDQLADSVGMPHSINDEPEPGYLDTLSRAVAEKFYQDTSSIPDFDTLAREFIALGNYMDADSQNITGDTLLHIIFQSLQQVQLDNLLFQVALRLLECGASPALKNQNGITVLDLIKSMSNQDSRDLALSYANRIPLKNIRDTIADYDQQLAEVHLNARKQREKKIDRALEELSAAWQDQHPTIGQAMKSLHHEIPIRPLSAELSALLESTRIEVITGDDNVYQRDDVTLAKRILSQFNHKLRAAISNNNSALSRAINDLDTITQRRLNNGAASAQLATFWQVPQRNADRASLLQVFKEALLETPAPGISPS